MTRFVLASASPARLRTLRAAGIEPEVIVSGVDESDVIGEPGWVALELARRKAGAVAALPDVAGALVVGCDSVLDLAGQTLGKPVDAADARRRWAALRGSTGVLRTGHCVIDTATGRSVSAVASTTVRFGSPTDAEVEAYIASGEPLQVAGAFTIDGRGGWFLDGVDGDAANVIGISLPLLRGLLAELGFAVTDFWQPVGGVTAEDVTDVVAAAARALGPPSTVTGTSLRLTSPGTAGRPSSTRRTTSSRTQPSSRPRCRRSTPTSRSATRRDTTARRC